MAKKSKAIVLRDKINFNLSRGVYKNNYSNLCSKYFLFLLYHVALQTAVILFLRGAKEHRRMKVNRN